MQVEKIVKGGLCAGCGACAAAFPEKLSFGLDERGYLRPRARAMLDQTDLSAISKLCPGIGQKGSIHKKSSLWGDSRRICTGHATDPELRWAGASGGALSGVLLWLLETGAVTGVIQIAADPDDPLGNRFVISESKADILAAAASRYAPSAPLLAVPQVMAREGRFAFVGKPCDVAALRNWSLLEPDLAQKIPVLLSFFCAGIPSRHGAVELVSKMGLGSQDLVRFRYRGQGWPGRSLAEVKSGEVRSLSYAQSWGEVLSRHVQPRCRICADGIGLEADLVFADAWESDPRGYPLFEERDGLSLIMARTDMGARLLQDAEGAGAVSTSPFEIDTLGAIQPGQLRRKQELLARLVGRRLGGKPVPRYRGLGVWQAARSIGVLRQLRVVIGMMRRCLIRRSEGG